MTGSLPAWGQWGEQGRIYNIYLHCSRSTEETEAKVFSGELLEPAQIDCHDSSPLSSLLSPQVCKAVDSQHVAGLAAVKLSVPGSDQR